MFLFCCFWVEVSACFGWEGEGEGCVGSAWGAAVRSVLQGEHSVGKYRCLLCQKEFSSESGVKYHIIKAHSEVRKLHFQVPAMRSCWLFPSPARSRARQLPSVVMTWWCGTDLASQAEGLGVPSTHRLMPVCVPLGR